MRLQPEGDVLVDREVREEGVVLEDRVHVPLVRRQPGDVLALELDQARRRLLEPADHPQGRGLATAGRAEEAEELAVPDLEVDVIDGRRVTESLDDIDQTDVDFRHGAPSPRKSLAARGASRLDSADLRRWTGRVAGG